jgi:uncharacterized protein (DUF302 family)
MQDKSTLIHCEHVSTRSFDEVVAAFSAAVGAGDGESFRKAVGAATGPEGFEARMRALEGSSGFMLFLETDHGAWMARAGLKARAKLYIIGNPLIARTMIEHDIGVGLNVPVRVLIYEEPITGACRLAYDLPSSLMGRLKNDRVNAAAKLLDQKLSALAETATGVPA